MSQDALPTNAIFIDIVNCEQYATDADTEDLSGLWRHSDASLCSGERQQQCGDLEEE